MLALALLGAAVWAFPYLWWGRGYSGAKAARNAPERIRAASTVYVYDAVIEVERDRVVFRRSAREPLRTGAITALAAAVAVLAMRGRRKARWWMLIGGLAAGATAYVYAQRRHPVVTVPRGVPGRVEVLAEGELTDDETHHDIVLVDGTRRTRLVRLPWNAGRDAELWRGLIEEKLRP